jgi:diguanylate cyclase (GGDEF)-like protein/PAS domain S-box-containing protein
MLKTRKVGILIAFPIFYFQNNQDIFIMVINFMEPNAMTKNKNEIETDLELFRDLINKTNDAIFVTNPQTGRFIFVNDQACASLGYDREELLKMNVMDIETNFPDNFSWQTHAEELRKKGSHMLEGIHKRKNGATFPNEANVSYVVLNTREYLVAVVRDITERKQAAEKLRKSEEKYRGLFDSTLDGVFQVNADGIFILMNMAGARLFGYETPEEIIGKPALEYWRDPKDKDAYLAELGTAKSVSAYPIRAKKKNGEPIELETSIRIVEDEQGNFLGVEGILRDVTERLQMEEQLRTLSARDELTGLYNRRGLFTLAEHLFEMANRAKRGLFILYGDVDNLKMINDTFGHKEGDNALISIATVFKETYRHSDIIARIGGDEFVVVMAGFAGDNAGVIAARLDRSLEMYNSGKDCGYNLSVSTGIAYYDPATPCSVEELLLQADKLMYEEKKRKNLDSL